jgi:hypothetical protein
MQPVEASKASDANIEARGEKRRKAFVFMGAEYDA